jgi:hypothetical protein
LIFKPTLALSGAEAAKNAGLKIKSNLSSLTIGVTGLTLALLESWRLTRQFCLTKLTALEPRIQA